MTGAVWALVLLLIYSLLGIGLSTGNSNGNPTPSIFKTPNDQAGIESSLARFSYLRPPPPVQVQGHILGYEGPPPIISRSIERNNFANWRSHPVIRRNPEFHFASTSHAEKPSFRRGPPYAQVPSVPVEAHQFTEPEYDYDEYYSDPGPRTEQRERSYVDDGYKSYPIQLNREKNLENLEPEHGPKENEPIVYQPRGTMKSIKPGSLAALLAGAGNIGKDRKTENHDSKTEPEYYDDALYDEFMDMYYDPNESKTSQASSTRATVAEDVSERKIESTTQHIQPNIVSIKRRTSTTEQHSTITTTTLPPYSTQSTTIQVITQKPETSSRQTSLRNNFPNSISLSEILQELELNLPQFLGSLSSHGTSLKEFTSKLQTKKLSKDEFRRVRGNVTKLFEILYDKEFKNLQQVNISASKATISTILVTTGKPSTTEFTPSLETELPTTEEVVQALHVEKSLTFGSRPGGVQLIKSNNTAEKSSSIATKPSIKLSILKENGANAADILGEFKTMFNVTTVPEEENLYNSTSKPRLTTVPLRQYRQEPQRPRPYRPRGYNKNWWDSRRGLINSRMSSTERPTLRPPYVPKPHNPTSSKESPSVVFGESVIVDKVNNKEKKSEKTVQQRNPYQSTRNNDHYKKIDEIDLDVATRSAIMAASILGSVALSVFITIFIVVKYRSHLHKNRRRVPFTLPSDTSSSSSPSLPPIYASRSCLSKEAYRTSGFWNTLKKRFDPYAINAQPSSIRDPYFYTKN